MTHDLARSFFDALEEGDLGKIEALCAPGAIVWHNTDGVERPYLQALKGLGRLFRALPVRRYVDRRVDVYPGGFVQRHIMEGVRPDGASASIAFCIVFEVGDGLISRVDEYYDAAAMTKMINGAD